jgi:very-short-patch-repair endonuclease
MSLRLADARAPTHAPVLAMNPGQREEQLDSLASCELCKLVRPRRPGEPDGETRVEPHSLILCRRVDPLASGCIWDDPPLGPNVRPESIHSKLLRWVETAGWNAFAAPVSEREVWAAMRCVLREGSIRLGGHTRIVPHEFTWTSDGARLGGVGAAARQIVRRWPHGAIYHPELWALLMAETVAHSSTGGAVLHGVDAMVGEYEVEVTCRLPHLRAPGPYLILLAGIPDAERSTCTWLQAAMAAIATRTSPIPVDSSHERRVVALLQHRRVRFVKPIFVRDGMRVDFVLVDARIIIEVQGLSDPEYLAAKEEAIERIPRSAQYRGWRVIRWDPYLGEAIDVLAERLAACGL